MVWKMSIDLTRALVPSMGQHDPLDGFITCLQLQATAASLSGAPGAPGLSEATSDFASMLGRNWETADPLGIGGLLIDACRLAQLLERSDRAAGELVEALLDAALEGLDAYSRSGELSRPAAQRLAFRELGLAIGMAAVGIARCAGARARAQLGALAGHARLAGAITAGTPPGVSTATSTR
jgi:hypothetical protein